MRRLLVAGTLALGLGACGASQEPVAQLPSPSSSTPASTTAAAGGTPEDPMVVEPTTALLDWQPVEAGQTDQVTTNGTVTITVDQAGRTVTLTGTDARVSVPARHRVTDVLLDETYAVIVAQDDQEQAPSTATALNLATGEQREVPTNANGGTWAMYDGGLVHAVFQGNRYCLENVDLATLETLPVLCMAPEHGFSQATITPFGETLLTFDSRPTGSCRTPSQYGDELVPLAEVAPCHGWDSLLTGDGQVWSEVPKENQVESARFYARAGDTYFDLGVGTTGSLTWCGDSAYFVRDSQKDVDKAGLLRWTPDHTLEVVYESPGEGNAFLSAPRCAGSVITISEQGEGGDEQVSARIPQ